MHTTLNVNSVFIEFTFRPSEWREFIATVKAAHPFKDSAGVNLNLRQDGSPQGRDSLSGSVHDSRVPSGTTPGSIFIVFTIEDKYRKR
ncbi:TPA: hypothetical protein R2K55_005791 [Raoultella ornithinolytica]|nr:hypothetical protein [Raoultella ornithinolytica]HEC2606761.1 hypothetical protein [Raoultella ornithinolytica]